MTFRIHPAMEAAPAYVGQRIPRLEDRDLLVGTASFVADLERPGQLHVSFVRSNAASGRLVSLDISDALNMDSVVAVITADDLPDGLVIPLRLASNPEAERARQPVLAKDVVRYVGEPIAAVVATSAYAAEDAAELVRVAIEPLPAVADCRAAVRAEADLVHATVQENVAVVRRVVDGDVEGAFAQADVVVRELIRIQRHTAVPLETRGVLAEIDPESGRLTVWGATKVKHFNRRALAELLGLPLELVRLVEVAVGGGFGVRGELYPEDVVVPWLAVELRRPIKWVEDRREHFVATNHSREQWGEVEVAATGDGDLLAIRLRALVDLGAYVRTNALVLPLNTATHLPGPYRWEAYAVEAQGVLTNRTPTATYRGPGMFEPAFYRERVLDMLARRLRVDPVELRRRNLITAELMPYTLQTGSDIEPVVYDGDDFPLIWKRLCEHTGYESLRAKLDARRARGELVGVGTAAFVEAGARGPYEWARVVPAADGSFTVHVGLGSVGQGIRTALTQIAADALGVPMARIRISHTSTDDISESAGSFSSRSTVFGAGAVLGAVHDLMEKASAAGASTLAVPRQDLELVAGGILRARGTMSPAVTLAELEVEGFHRFEKRGRAYSMGGALVVASVDAGTGQVKVERCVVVYNVGRAVNPLIVEGQLVGAAAQGLGGVLLEELPYDERGQPLATSFLDYMLPTAAELPAVEAVVLELARSPSDTEPTGIKGAGEAGIVGIGAAAANAVGDALPDGAGQPRELPLGPALVRTLIAEVASPG